VRDSYLSIRDTLRSVSAKSAILQRDARSSSDAVLLSRARGLDAACRASLRHLDRSREMMLAPGPGQRVPAPRRTALDRSFIELRATLTACGQEYRELSKRERVGEMRTRGVNQALKNQQAVRSFEAAADPYLLSLGVRIRPYGAGANPYAGGARKNR
jgi:hypothetical protein